MNEYFVIEDELGFANLSKAFSCGSFMTNFSWLGVINIMKQKSLLLVCR